MSSLGIRLIEPSNDGDGYWNFEKISIQTQDAYIITVRLRNKSGDDKSRNLTTGKKGCR